MGNNHFVESEPYLMTDESGNEVMVADLHWNGLSNKTQRSTKSEKFIFRIPLSWNQQATIHCPNYLKVANLLWYRAGLTRSRTVTLPSTLLESHDISRFAKYRALDALEKAGLVKTKNQSGCTAEVTLLNVS